MSTGPVFPDYTNGLDAGTPVSMAHLLRATHLEAAKRETSLSDAETRGWA